MVIPAEGESKLGESGFHPTVNASATSTAAYSGTKTHDHRVPVTIEDLERQTIL